MNTRRNFLKNVVLGGASFAILPGAGRIWKVERVTKIVPFWYQTFQRSRWISPAYVAAYKKLQDEDPNFNNLVFEACVRMSNPKSGYAN